MKATLRKNRMRLADIRVTFTVSAGQLAKAVMQDMALSPGTAARREYTRVRVEMLVREELRQHGEAMNHLGNDGEFEEAAWVVVRRLFPEMCK